MLASRTCRILAGMVVLGVWKMSRAIPQGHQAVEVRHLAAGPAQRLGEKARYCVLRGLSEA